MHHGSLQPLQGVGEYKRACARDARWDGRRGVMPPFVWLRCSRRPLSCAQVYVGEVVMHSSKVYERLRDNVGIDDHLALLNVILTKVIHNLKVRLPAAAARPGTAPTCRPAGQHVYCKSHSTPPAAVRLAGLPRADRIASRGAFFGPEARGRSGTAA